MNNHAVWQSAYLAMLESHAKAERNRALYEAHQAAIQNMLSVYSTIISTQLLGFMYAGMFNPNFCKPADGDTLT